MFTSFENHHPITYDPTIVKMNLPKSGRKKNRSKHRIYKRPLWTDEAIKMTKQIIDRHDRNKLINRLRRNKVLDVNS